MEALWALLSDVSPVLLINLEAPQNSSLLLLEMGEYGFNLRSSLFVFFLSGRSAPHSFIRKRRKFSYEAFKVSSNFKKTRRGRQSVQDCRWSLGLLRNERQGLSKPQLNLY